MTRYRVQVTGEMQVETDSSEEFIVTQVRDMLGDDLSLAAQGLALEVVATQVPDEAMERPIRCCYWCGSRFRSTPGPDSQGQRYCSSECSIDSKNLSEER